MDISAQHQKAPENFAQPQKRNLNVPDLPAELYKDQYKYRTYNTNNTPPFLATTEAIVTELHNSDPNLLRSTLYTLPQSEYSLSTCGIPFSLIASPFCGKAMYAEAPHVTQCGFCRSYYNCFTKKSGTANVCNICRKESDIIIKSEESLHSSSIECTRSGSEGAKPNSESAKETAESGKHPERAQRPVFMFILDGKFCYLKEAISEVKEICRNENFQYLYESVIFVALNREVMLFKTCKGSMTKVKMPANPPKIFSDVCVKTGDTGLISDILDSIYTECTSPERHPRTPSEDNDACGINNCIRIIEDLSLCFLGIKVALLSPVCIPDINYEAILRDLKNVTINVFSENQPDKSNSIHRLAFYSAGCIHTYSKHSSSEGMGHSNPESIKLGRDLFNVAITPTVFNLSLVLKTSDNISKTGIIASALEENYSVTRINAMDEHSTITFNLTLGGFSKETKYCQLQINYINYDGEAKIRILNHMFPSGKLPQVYSDLSVDTLFAALVKEAVSKGGGIYAPLVEMLSLYRKKCSNSASSTQFVLPDSLKCLPVLIQAYDKKMGIEKVRLISMGVERMLRYFYPRMIRLSEYNKTLSETPGLRLSARMVTDDDIYILEDGIRIYVYVGKGVGEDLVEKLFDLRDPACLRLLEGEEEEQRLIKRVLDEIEMHYNYYLPYEIVISGHSNKEAEFLSYMVEDAVNNRPDYVDFIFQLHFKIQKA